PGVADSGSRVEIPSFTGQQVPMLLVEDNRETSFLLESYLRRSEFGVVQAHSIEEARMVLTQLRPAAVILDVMMEGEPSWELLTELQTQYSPPIPVLVVSVTGEAQQAFALGASGFLQKPVAPESLLHKLREITYGADRCRVLVVDDDEVSRYLL